MPNHLLVAIVGPTAVGKTAISIQVAEHFNTEIVSADSRQFYKEMEIGTAKPSLAEVSKITHHFINSLSIQDEYNVGKYEKEALDCIENIFKKHDKVILVGGSGLFVNAVCHGLDVLPEGDNATREKYEKVLQEQGIEALQEELKSKDPLYFEEVDQKNPRRLIRALEVIHASGLPYSHFRNKKSKVRSFSIAKIGLNIDKQLLVERINTRIDSMLKAGWLEECKSLYPYRNFNALKTVGYSELFDFIDGKFDWDTTVEQIKINTWHYAKRQLTWLRKDKEIKWFSPSDREGIYEYISTFESLQDNRV
ncbi:MAG TPA: tRNA (adenosine(37)-N6)-dimethylallyltransferase MiaA [Bacteroidia bacterium]|nr:tRNA (adenosine(37)-N6)-dimethylallyltransferase MiaA [Bacteroidia bacterium]